MMVFRTLGLLMFFIAALFALLALASWHTTSIIGQQLKPAIIPAAIFFLLGFGLFHYRKSAALLMALVSFSCAMWLIIGSLIVVPFPWWLLNIAFGVVILIPTWLVVKNWRTLSRW
jgi:hypothetical protein